ncbi:MAG: 2OG-Fe(II) oxygenase family protein [Hyphomonas sp.]|nr:2OG-Fe(II) oxygenase family protein [Hyphomonas sp.]
MTEPKGQPLPMDATRMGLFETPVVVARLKEAEGLIEELRAAIQKRKAESSGMSKSNQGGWHSDTSMLQWGGPAAKTIANQAIAIACRLTHFEEYRLDEVRWRVGMWANVSGRGAINHRHVHPGNLWSAVFYVDLGQGGDGSEDVGGDLFFEDPRLPMAAMLSADFRFVGSDGTPQRWEPEVRPAPGSLIVFPSWLAHGVRPYMGDGERISVAINLEPIFPRD